MRLKRSQAGFTLLELMVVIAVSGVLMAMAATGFSAFFAKFDEMNKAMELQRDAFNCMQTIKNGIPIGSGASLKFQGIATADSVVFQGTDATQAGSIILYPPASDYTHQNDFIRIYRDGAFVRATYLNGSIQPASPLYLFPKNVRGNTIEVTKLNFAKTNSTESITRVITVTLEARVKLKNNKYKMVAYSTRMALSLK